MFRSEHKKALLFRIAAVSLAEGGGVEPPSLVRAPVFETVGLASCAQTLRRYTYGAVRISLSMREP